MSDRYIGSIDSTMAMAHKRRTVAAVVENAEKYGGVLFPQARSVLVVII